VLQGSRGKSSFEEPTVAESSAGDALEISRLASALAVTEVEDLTLSTGLNGLHVAGFPNLKTLTVDFSKGDTYPQVPYGCFVNVITLNIQCIETDLVGPDFALKLRSLNSSHRNFRTLEFMSVEAALCGSIPSNVESIINRLQFDTTAPISKGKLNSHRNAIQKRLLLLYNVPSGWNLRYLHAYWPDRSDIRNIGDVRSLWFLRLV
jgi:hypothetical protein